jgi:hypothetical protein
MPIRVHLCSSVRRGRENFGQDSGGIQGCVRIPGQIVGTVGYPPDSISHQ